MALRYITVEKQAEASFVRKHSRFIGMVAPVQSRKDAEVFLAFAREKYRNATHYAACFVIGEKGELQWASDGGEPAGTAGAPMLGILVNKGVRNAAAVAIRYFGGIKLGTGGLVRAYSEAADLALKAAGLKEVRDIRKISVSLPYSAAGRFSSPEKDALFDIKEISYGENIVFTAEYEPEKEELVSSYLADISGGRAERLSSEDFVG